MLTLTRPLAPVEHDAALAIDAKIRAISPTLQPAHVALWNDQPTVVRDRKTTAPWLLTPFEHDPYRTKDGGYPLPAEVRRELDALGKAHLPFDTIAVAHELDESPHVTAMLAKAGPSGVQVTPRQASLVLGRLPAPAGLQRKARGVDALVAKAGGLFGAGVGALMAAPAVLLDPIMFGVCLLEESSVPGRIALYYPLVAWEW